MAPSSTMKAAVDVSPPIGGSSLSSTFRRRRSAATARTSSNETRTPCFATSTGREQARYERPQTSRPRSSFSDGHTLLNTTPDWQFLTSEPSTSYTTPHRPRLRPTTARTFTGPSNTKSIVPNRPMTGRRPSQTLQYLSVDPRVIAEAARREVEQEQYVNPLIGRSVEVQPTCSAFISSIGTSKSTMMSPREAVVTNAISRPEGHRTKAILARTKGDLKNAITQYEQLLECNPIDRTALFQLAVSYEKTGRFNDALRTYNHLVPLDSENPYLYYNRGNLLMKLGQVQDAIASYTIAIQLITTVPKHKQKLFATPSQIFVFYRERGTAYRQQGDFEKAAQDYARVHAYQRRQSVSSSVQPVSLEGPEDVEVGNERYTATPLYQLPSTEDSHKTMGGQPLEAWNYHRTLEIALSPRSKRTQTDLEFLADALQQRFPLCASLELSACIYLASRIQGYTEIPNGTILFNEGEEIGHLMFLVCNGEITAYKKKTVAPHGDQTAVDLPLEVVMSWEDMSAPREQSDDSDWDDYEDVVLHEAISKLPTISDVNQWIARQFILYRLHFGESFGQQGLHTTQSRSYSAVVTAGPCELFVFSWNDWVEAERRHRIACAPQLARFLHTVPVLSGIPSSELVQLAQVAKSTKVIGSRVICSEGQYVNGLIIVRDGQLCQLHPSSLDRPPNLEVSYSLSGAITIPSKSKEQCGAHFFLQLEWNHDPLFFVHDSGAMHGFLPDSLIPNVIQTLSTSRDESSHQSIVQSLCRGAYFSASSGWIPPRKTREQTIVGVACAKKTLVSLETSVLLFFTPSDLIDSLSIESRTRLYQNMSQRIQPIDHSIQPRHRTTQIGFLQPSHGDNLVQRYKHDVKWEIYKKQLVDDIVKEKQQNKRRTLFHQTEKQLVQWKR